MPCSACGFPGTDPEVMKNHLAQCKPFKFERLMAAMEEYHTAGSVEVPSATPTAMEDSPPALSDDMIPEILENVSNVVRGGAAAPLPFIDEFPPPVSVIPDAPPAVQVPVQQDNTSVLAGKPFRTKPNHFGIFRVYPSGRPTYTPDILLTPNDLIDHQASPQSLERWWDQLSSSLETFVPQNDPTKPPPFPPSVQLLLDWFWDPQSTIKTFSDADKLVKNVIKDPQFQVSDFAKFWGTARETEKLDEFLNSPESFLPTSDKWITSSVTLPLPCVGRSFNSEDEAPSFQVEGLHHRKILDVLKAALSEPSGQFWHFSGYEEFWRPSPTSRKQRTVSEIYNTDAFLRAEKEVKERAAAAGSDLEASVVPLQLWSDSTHLATFGTASLWPVYLYPGNLSKYIRCRPTTFSANHIAYIPKLTDNIQDIYQQEHQRAPTDSILAYLRCELFQRIWLKLIDDEFMHAYYHGFEWKCADGVTRLLFPRIITYSGDYPERATIACIKRLGRHPCPLCLVPKSKIRNLGMPSDDNYRHNHPRFDDPARWYDLGKAHKRIFQGEDPKWTWFEKVLGPQSLVASRSAFSILFEDDPNFQHFKILAPDALHEVELGSFKATFTHLVRMLHVVGANSVATLNSRYRQTPSYGRDTIRRFSNNASEMKKLGARDFEDLLQCAIPAFRDLFHTKVHNDEVRVLIFELLTWHALAKLRRHTDATIADLKTSTARLGTCLRHFADVLAPKYATRDLPKERERRIRALARQKVPEVASTSARSKPGQMKLDTYKLHALGHYADLLYEIGTTDGYSTQIGESQHRHVKRWYTRVRKGNSTYVVGIARQQRRERALFQLRAKATGSRRKKIDTKNQFFLPFEYSEKLDKAPPLAHHQMSKAVKRENRINLPQFIEENPGDPALKDFVRRLKTHILLRFQKKPFDGDEEQFTMEELNQVIIVDDTIYRHKALRIFNTTYDMRRGQDSASARRQSDLMVLARDDQQYWYCRLIGIFHARFIHNTPAAALGVRAQEMEFLWVRWFGAAKGHKFGWAAKDLPRIGFINERSKGDDTMGFGFLNPSEVIRTVHLIPAFTYQKGINGIPRTIARPESDNNQDWNYFYVNIFADRDMFMHYRGGGIGHAAIANVTNMGLRDRDPSDKVSFSATESDDLDVEMDSDTESESSAGGSEVLDEALDWDYEWEEQSGGEGSEGEADDAEDLMASLGQDDGEESEDDDEHTAVGFGVF